MPSLSESVSRMLGIPSESASPTPSIASGIPSPSESRPASPASVEELEASFVDVGVVVAEAVGITNSVVGSGSADTALSVAERVDVSMCSICVSAKAVEGAVSEGVVVGSVVWVFVSDSAPVVGSAEVLLTVGAGDSAVEAAAVEKVVVDDEPDAKILVAAMGFVVMGRVVEIVVETGVARVVLTVPTAAVEAITGDVDGVLKREASVVPEATDINVAVILVAATLVGVVIEVLGTVAVVVAGVMVMAAETVVVVGGMVAEVAMVRVVFAMVILLITAVVMAAVDVGVCDAVG